MFSMQGVGYLAAHVTGLCLLVVIPQDSSWAWRLLLGLGAVLPLALVVSLSLALARARRYRLVQSAVAGLEDEEEDMEGAIGADGGGAGGRRRSEGGGERGDAGASSPARFWLSVRDKRRLLWKLFGTAGSWFLFDVTFYGNQLVSTDDRWPRCAWAYIYIEEVRRSISRSPRRRRRIFFFVKCVGFFMTTTLPNPSAAHMRSRSHAQRHKVCNSSIPNRHAVSLRRTAVLLCCGVCAWAAWVFLSVRG